jgi:hypothetical protein
MWWKFQKDWSGFEAVGETIHNFREKKTLSILFVTHRFIIRKTKKLPAHNRKNPQIHPFFFGTHRSWAKNKKLPAHDLKPPQIHIYPYSHSFSERAVSWAKNSKITRSQLKKPQIHIYKYPFFFGTHRLMKRRDTFQRWVLPRALPGERNKQKKTRSWPKKPPNSYIQISIPFRNAPFKEKKRYVPKMSAATGTARRKK